MAESTPDVELTPITSETLLAGFVAPSRTLCLRGGDTLPPLQDGYVYMVSVALDLTRGGGWEQAPPHACVATTEPNAPTVRLSPAELTALFSGAACGVAGPVMLPRHPNGFAYRVQSCPAITVKDAAGAGLWTFGTDQDSASGTSTSDEPSQ
jgi:hypothetical protein